MDEQHGETQIVTALVPHNGDDRRTGDRRQRRDWVWRERRTGFNRRRDPGSHLGAAWDRALVYLRVNPLTLVLVLALANLLSLLDLAFTLRALSLGAVEVNPLMNALLAHDPARAVDVKVCLVAGVSLLLFLMRRYRSMLGVALLMSALFATIVAYHFFGALFFI